MAIDTAYHRRLSRRSSWLVTEAMEAYQSFCLAVPRYIGGDEETTPRTPVDMGTVLADFQRATEWEAAYKEEYIRCSETPRALMWWDVTTKSEILPLVWDLPLNDESHQEVKLVIDMVVRA